MKISLKNIFLLFLLFTQLFIWTQAKAFEPFVISDIKVVGIERVSKEAVLESIDVRPGYTFNQSKAPKVIRSLFQSGFFKNVELEREGNVLVINVIERPIIAEFELKGVRGREKVLAKLRKYNIAKGRMYNPSDLAKAQEELENYYLSTGKYGVRVETKVTKISESKIDLKIDIFTGDEARIKQIKIVGNEFFKEKELLSKINHAKTGLFSWFNKRDQYAKEKLAADLEILRSYYMDRGFVNFRINSTQVSLTPDKKGLYININITEGKRYLFGGVDASGNLIISKEEMLKIIKSIIKPGTHFSRKKLWDTKKAIEERLGIEGFSKADVRFNLEPNDEKNTIGINFFIEPLKRIYVRRINIVGNALTEDVVIRRMFLQNEGTWINTEDIKKGKGYIMRAGYAGEVNVETTPVIGKDDQVDITYNIEEQKTAQLSAGLSYSQADRIMIDIGADFRNFVGTGKDLGFNFSRGRDFTNYTFNYYDPYFTKDGVGFGYSLYYVKSNFSKISNVFSYANNTYGGSLRWSYPVTEYSRINFGFAYDHTRLVYDDSGAPLEVQEFNTAEGKMFDEYSLFGGWSRTTLDRFIFPTTGTYQSFSAKLSTLLSDLKYYSVGYNFSWYQPIYEKDYIFHFTNRLGYGNKYGSTFRYPFHKNYHLGGEDSVRGYEARSLGPFDSKGKRHGGNALFQVSGEVIFPTPFFTKSKSLRTSLFLDAGQVYDTENKYRTINGHTESRNPTGIRYSAGICLKWHSPLGVPMIFALAKPLNAKGNDKKQNFIFTFGASLF